MSNIMRTECNLNPHPMALCNHNYRDYLSSRYHILFAIPQFRVASSHAHDGLSRETYRCSTQTDKLQRNQPLPGNHATQPSARRCHRAARSTASRPARCSSTSASSAGHACLNPYFSSVTLFRLLSIPLDSRNPVSFTSAPPSPASRNADTPPSRYRHSHP